MIRRDGALVEVPIREALDLVAQPPPRDRPAARQGQHRRLWIRAVDHSGRLRRVEALQGRAGHEQRRNQHPALRGQCDGRPREQLRPRRRDRMLRGHRSRRRVRPLGRQPRRDRPGSLLAHAGPTGGRPRGPHHRPATRTTRTSYAADQSCCTRRTRRWPSRTPFATRSWRASGSIAISSIGTSRSSAARPASDTASPTTRSSSTTPQPSTWDDYVAFLSSSSPERAQQLSGVPAESIRWLASLYGDRSRR